MISSMTGFASQEVSVATGLIRWDLKSVNQRYLEPSFKLPEAFQELEYPLRMLLSSQLRRGKVSCVLQYEPHSPPESALVIDFSLVEQLIKASKEIAERIGTAHSISPFEILRWPSVIKVSEKHSSEITADIEHCFLTALSELQKARQREGAELKNAIQNRLDKMENLLLTLQIRLPEVRALYRERLLEKIKNVHLEYEPHRLEQEMMFVAQKMDVDEECDRLASHLKGVRNILNGGGPVGRQLDFLMQELNREVNTLSSKSIDVLITQQSVEMKVLIEQMREQIQNLE